MQGGHRRKSCFDTIPVCSSSKKISKRGTEQFTKIVIYLLFLLIGSIKSRMEVSKEFSDRSLININAHASLITETEPGAHSYSPGRPNWDEIQIIIKFITIIWFH